MARRPNANIDSAGEPFTTKPWSQFAMSYMAMGLVAGFPLLLLSIIAASIIFTWLYNSTRGSQ